MLSWLLKAGAFTAMLRVIAIVTTLAFVSVMSHLLPKADFGTLALFVSVVTLAGTVGSFGQSEWTIKHASPRHSAGESDRVKQTIAEATKRVIVFSLPIACIVSLFFWTRGDGFVLALLSALNTIALSICIAWAGASRSVDKLLWSIAPKDIIWRAGAILFSFGLISFGIAMNLDLVALGMFGVLTIALLFQSRSLSVSFTDIINAPLGDWATWVVGLQIMISMVAIVAQNTLDVLFVGTFMSSEAAAEYFPANRIALVAGFFFLPFQMVISPRLARFAASKQNKELRNLYTLGTILLTTMTTALSAALILSFKYYAPAFETISASSKYCIQILCISQIISSTMGFPGIVLIVHSSQKLLAQINLLVFAISTPTLLFATQTQKIEYVAIATGSLIVLRKLLAATACAIKIKVYPISISHWRKIDESA